LSPLKSSNAKTTAVTPSDFPLSPLPEPFAGGIGHSMKHPSGLIEFAQRRRDGNIENLNSNGHVAGAISVHNDVPPTYLTDLDTIDFSNLQTPASLFLPTTAYETFQKATDLTVLKEANYVFLGLST
jgi:diaminopimelate decarboxylase